MAKSILPSGEVLSNSPEEILRYANVDSIRQLMRQHRVLWNMKTSKNIEYIDNTTLYKYAGSVHNNEGYQKMEVRTFPDNNAPEGYAGILVDSGMVGWPYNTDKWDNALSDESKLAKVNRVVIGSVCKISNKEGCGLDDSNNMSQNTTNRSAMIAFDPYDGRAYLFSNDNIKYVNNESRQEDEKLPSRTIARIGDIPTRITQLNNDLNFISDPDYHHTDNNFTNSNRYILDNLDDRTFVYPEISRDFNGNDLIANRRISLKGEPYYGESDEPETKNTQPDLGTEPLMGRYGDRQGDANSNYNINKNFSGVNHPSGYLPGIFRSYEELCRVDLVDQTYTIRTHEATPGARRSSNYYLHDGIWSNNWFENNGINNSYKEEALNPFNMERKIDNMEPTPYNQLAQNNPIYKTTKLHQWRYNRIVNLYHSTDISINIIKSGSNYRKGDLLQWSFADDTFVYEVTEVGDKGQIQAGNYIVEENKIFEQDPSTRGIGIEFSNTSGIGSGALLEIKSKATIEVHSGQIKNNLYAYVDICPTVRSENHTPWSDSKEVNNQEGLIVKQSTAAGPAYSGINSGIGGPDNDKFYEHGGNATAGVHVHLFRYVIDTLNPSYVERDGIKIYLGKWIDQGPLSLERPCDIKALLFSNADCNNFNNYYKFSMDNLIKKMNTSGDGVESVDDNTTEIPRVHIAQKDPEPDQKFYEKQFNPHTGLLENIDITDKVLYINIVSPMIFKYNTGYKIDEHYGTRTIGWIPLTKPDRPRLDD